jgi:hypothetical protein
MQTIGSLFFGRPAWLGDVLQLVFLAAVVARLGWMVPEVGIAVVMGFVQWLRQRQG